MELHQLAYVVAVAEEANFTRAAERLHVAQPGVSAQVRRLERELGQPLFDRSGRTVRLTGVGAAVLPHARAALAAVEAVRETVSEHDGLVRGQVAMGMVTSAGPVALPEFLAGFAEHYPGVEITLAEANSDVMAEALREGRLDVAVIGLADGVPAGLATQVLLDEELVAVTGPGDDFVRRADVTLADLAGRSLICLPKGTGVRGVLDRAFAAAGLRPRVTIEASDPNVLAQLAMRDLGVALVPESLARYYAAELHRLPLRPSLRGQLALAWRATGPAGPAARALIQFARTTLDGASSSAEGAR
ncbi:LysR family transcriptional regulator [Amycolatopsis jiangsuensis]|uniref:DNA-binding transcriptional LysR family regulator n=1 Tax=Amycolatopsis jiangsuensis TaxID=1181879 RepID=A0A840J483_9PSEU|nr:LysR family transcriptional regulator [Amycolatopsis jiangsuensis]MBB4688124.1 DNA-binding transcriptional LysR family regulator [Amycolatopsis jiangsuensis]